jgi:hypothetical protein
MISGFEASGFMVKIDEKTIKEPSQERSESGDRFFIDFGSILGRFGGPKSTKNRSEKPSNK